MKFGENLKAIRESKHMSQEDFAKLFDTSKQVISRYENGLRVPKITVASKFAEILGVELCDLIGDTYNDNNNASEFKELNYPNIMPIRVRRLPLLGEIACGKPIFADEDRENYVEIGTDVQADFRFRAKGDSMTGARIMDGDIVFNCFYP